MQVANPARNEVDLAINGDVFVLRGSFEDLAKLQQASGFVGMPALMNAAILYDLRVLFFGLKLFAISGPADKLSDIPAHVVIENSTAIGKAIIRILEGPKDADAGNAPGAAAESLN